MVARTLDVLLLALTAVVFGASFGAALRMDLATLLKGRNNQKAQLQNAAQKRDDPDSGNPCPTTEKPFPCKIGSTCIPMAYVCDDNIDCLEDGYDEEPEVCTAAHRPPFDEIMNFLEAEKSWIMPNLFGDRNIFKVAHGLAVSQTVDDFRRRIGLKAHEVINLKDALKDVKNGDGSALEALGMPRNAWNEVSYIFSKLIKSGFSA